ncbi:serine/threonine-protein kinase [Corynebacterium xerosis]|uniref:non-specific serine/threonine protein kinase n=2 Tax=Corynebacterium xerosis TaxID=1725 RepID=A0A7X9SVH6_9CORY|nr:serine/threonine-protein kinase [Corynebacterium xerosis]NMF08799.1 serine/threonine protein kinase [Corynebacterium xerosis]HJG58314.1 serine/threonine protein kinase [Corynebacterium xerosis]
MAANNDPGSPDVELDNVQATLGTSRYRVRSLLGRGGMSSVWLADDLAAGDRPVAVKILNRELGDDAEFRQRFRNEASAARSVDSPNVVAIHSHEEPGPGAAGPCYIVMEYIRGESLADVLRRRRTLPEHLALDVVEQTAHGLSAIHAADLIHRDIKPGNLLVTPEGTVKITDFGIAKAAEAVPLTRTGMVVGTAQYVSPEQAQGKQVTPSTDVYSLGCVAYEMVAGRRPFAGDTTVAVAVAHINEPPPALPQTVHPHIRELIGIMLRKDPARRYADGRELAKAVLQVRQGHRPPQPAGVQPQVHRQSDAAHPATSELGALTEPGLRRPTEMRTGQFAGAPGHTAARPAQRGPAAAAPAAAPRRKPARKKSNAGLWLTLILLLAVLAGAIWILLGAMSERGTGTPGSSSETTTTEQSWTEPTGTTDDEPTWTPSEEPETTTPEETLTPEEPTIPSLPGLPEIPDLGGGGDGGNPNSGPGNNSGNSGNQGNGGGGGDVNGAPFLPGLPPPPGLPG